MALLNCIVVTPEKTAVESKADFIVLPLYDGEIGIASGRAPLIGRLGFGEMRLKVGDKVTRYYLDGGFVQVAGDVVSVLTNRAMLASEVDGQAAQQQLDEALTPVDRHRGIRRDPRSQHRSGPCSNPRL